jgi:hypothetical protein
MVRLSPQTGIDSTMRVTTGDVEGSGAQSMRRTSSSQLSTVQRGALSALLVALVIGAVGYLRDWTGQSWMLGGLVGAIAVGVFIASDARRLRRTKATDEGSDANGSTGSLPT